MSRQDARDQARAEVVAGGRTASPQYQSNVACYRRWCAANNVLAQPPKGPKKAWPEKYPGPTKVLLRFLHAEYAAGETPRWSSAHVTSLIRDVTTELGRLGHGDHLDTEVLARYRRQVTKKLGTTRLRPVDALTKEQVQALPERAEEEVHPISARTVRLRGVIAAAEALEVDPTALGGLIQGLHRSAFTVRRDAVIITVDPDAPQPVTQQLCQFPGGCTRTAPPRTARTRGKGALYCGQRDAQTGRMHDAKTAYRARQAGLVPIAAAAPGDTAGTAAKPAKPGKGEKGTRTRRLPRGLLDAEREPLMYATLVAALEAAGDAEFPLVPPAEEQGSHSLAARLKRDSDSLFLAWTRAFPTRAARREHSARLPDDELRPQIAASTAEDRVWWLAQVDEWLWLRRRDAAYAIAGIATARRHIELQRAVLGDFTKFDAGYEYVVRDHKGNKIARVFGGKEVLLKRVIPHLVDDPADAPANCPAHCPACRMRDHLEVRERSGAGDADPLFIGLDGTVLGRDGGNHVLKRLAELVEDLGYNPDGTPRSISTRTLRVTAATLARRSGLSYREIADEVTGHRSEDQAALYVRRHDIFSVGLVLSLDGSEPQPVDDRNAASAASRNAATEEEPDNDVA